MPYSKATIEEERIGLELFFTDTPGIGGRMKKQPEDFIVTERSIDIEPLSETEEKILALLSDVPAHVDQIADRFGLGTSRVMGILLALELKNAVKQIAGKRFVKF